MSLGLPSLSQKSIIYVGPTPFPSNSAASMRIQGNALALKKAGYNVVILAGQVADCSKELKSTEYGLTIIPVGERTFESYPRLLKHVLYFNMGRKTLTKLENLDIDLHAIILYSGYSPFLLKLLPWCKKRNIPLVFDTVEWYEPQKAFTKWINPYYLNIEFAMRILLVKTKNIIAISSYLETYYADKGCNTVRIPPILDTQKMLYRLDSNENKRVVISYTGFPGYKDLFNNYLEAVLTIDPEGKQMVLHVAGVSEEQLFKFPAFTRREITKLPSCIISEGFVPHARAVEITREADFSVLQRRDKRNANAGFPTKIVESLSCGTPVIINYTSDLRYYIEDEKEGIVCTDSSAQSLVEAFKRVLALPQEQILQMRHHARKRVESSFDFRNYTSALQSFIEHIGE